MKYPAAMMKTGPLEQLAWQIYMLTVLKIIFFTYSSNMLFVLQYLFTFWAYCTISFNLAGLVMHDGPAEILVSAPSQSCHDMPKFFWQFSTAGDKKFLYLEHVRQMILAPDEIYRDLCDISTFWRAP